MITGLKKAKGELDAALKITKLDPVNEKQVKSLTDRIVKELYDSGAWPYVLGEAGCGQSGDKGQGAQVHNASVTDSFTKDASFLPATKIIRAALSMDDRLTMAVRSKFARQPGENDSGNIAIAEFTQNGKTITIQAFSGLKDLPGFASYARVTNQKPLGIPQGMIPDRAGDTEARILGHILDATGPNTCATLVIKTERYPCPFCTNAFKKFKELRPQITLDIRYAFDKN